MQDGARWRWRERVARGKTCVATEGGARDERAFVYPWPRLVPWRAGPPSLAGRGDLCSAQVLWLTLGACRDFCLRQGRDVPLDGFHSDESPIITFLGFELATAQQFVDCRSAAADKLAGLGNGDQQGLDLHFHHG